MIQRPISRSRQRPTRVAVIAIAAAVATNAALVLTLAWISRAQPVLETIALPPIQRITFADPAVEAPQPTAPARAPAAEAQVAVPPQALELPDLDQGPTLPRAPSELAAPALPVLPLALPEFVSDAAGAAGPDSDDRLPAMAALGPGDAMPELVSPINLERFYPRSALRRGIAGDTRLRLTIDADGRVLDCAVLSSDPPGEFEEQARKLGMSLRFRPERRSGQAVPSVVVHPVHWSPP